MRSRCVGLVTGDPALYADLASALRERGVPSVSLWPGDRIPERVAVVLTSPAEAAAIPHPNVLAVVPDSGRPALWAAVQSALTGDRTMRETELVIGLDPGPTPGFAVTSGGRLLAQGVLSSPEAAATFAATLEHRFPGRALRFRIGSGDPPDRNRIVRALGRSRHAVELVDEHHTTPRIARRHRDAAAARAIARLPGRSFPELPPVRPTLGAITNLQRLSREGSEGRFSISRAMARRVLLGELTLGEALEQGPVPSDPPGSTALDGRAGEPS